MTVIIGGSTIVDLDDFCCCDPEVGGCPHPLNVHEGGRCVPHCPCIGPMAHTPTCVHRQPQTGGE